jgi:hypothetical protein
VTRYLNSRLENKKKAPREEKDGGQGIRDSMFQGSSMGARIMAGAELAWEPQLRDCVFQLGQGQYVKVLPGFGLHLEYEGKTTS